MLLTVAGDAPAPMRPPAVDVLVVDDDPEVRETTRDMIATEGYHVAVASSGTEGLSLLADGLRPRLVVLDYRMPSMNGRDFIQRLRTELHRGDLPVVLVSAYPEAHAAVEPDWIVQFLPKPFRLSALLAIVNEHCGPPPAGDVR